MSYLPELTADLLYAMDILMDPSGTSELVYDFPNEAWASVWQRETRQIREFCEQGKMVLWLLEGVIRKWGDTKECEFVESDEIAEPCKWLHLPTGQLLVVAANELIQCLAYPELEMEKIFEWSFASGWYAVQNEGMDKIMYCKKQPTHSRFSNIQEIRRKKGRPLPPRMELGLGGSTDGR